MANNILFDYAFNFDEIRGTGKASLYFLHQCYLPVIANVPKPAAPEFTTQPQPENQSIDVAGGQEVGDIFAEATDSTGSTLGIKYQWQKTSTPVDPESWVDIENAIDKRLAPEQPSSVDYFMVYRCKATDKMGLFSYSNISSVAGFDPALPPVILQEILATADGVSVKDANPSHAGAMVGGMGGYSIKDNQVATVASVVACYSMEDVSKYTANKDAQALFDAGMGAVNLVLYWDDAIAEINGAKLNENDCYTFLHSSDLTRGERQALTRPEGYRGVVGLFTDDTEYAKKMAIAELTCCFLDKNNLCYGMHYAFGKLLSANKWSDQQYIQAPAVSEETPDHGRVPSVTSIEEYGEADMLFKARVSFYLYDETQGDRLAFFGQGGDPITAPYIYQELKLAMQSAGVTYLSGQQPRMTVGEIIRLENRLRDVLLVYTDSYNYLDPDANNSIRLYVANERYCLQGDLTICVSDPIWRVFVTARQDCNY